MNNMVVNNIVTDSIPASATDRPCRECLVVRNWIGSVS